MQTFQHEVDRCGMTDFEGGRGSGALHEQCTCGKWAHIVNTERTQRVWRCLGCGRRFKTPREDAVITPQVDLFGERREPPRRRRYRSVPVPEQDPARPLFPQSDGEMGKLELAFWTFHTENPGVYRFLVRFCLEWRKARGEEAQVGIGALFERVRWETGLQTTDEHGLKLNNNHRAFYARLLMDSDPRLKEIFSLRRQRQQSSVGPKNETLPDSEHIA